MKNILIAVDDSSGAKACIAACIRSFSDQPPKSVVLVHVQQFGGKTFMHDRLSDAEVSDLQEDLVGTETQEALERNSNAILEFHKKSLEESGIHKIKTVIRSGHVAEEIVNAAKEEGVDMIIIGNTRSLIDKLIMGDVTKEVSRMTETPILLAK